MNPSAPAKIIRFCREIEDAGLTTSELLVDIIKRNNLLLPDFKNYLKHDHNPGFSYGRSKVYEGKNFSVFVMSWAPGDFTAIHSHGLTDWGAVVFFTEIHHRLYELTGNTIKLAGKSIVPAGTIVPVNGNLIHAMGSLGQASFTSLHIYGSNKNIPNANTDSRIYELEYSRIRTTNGSAYINSPDENCSETLYGLNADKDTLLDYLNIILPFYRKNKIVKVSTQIEAMLKAL